jgi:flagellar protein FlaF
MSLEAYSRARNVSENPRDTEYRLFAQVTRSLIEAEERGARDKAFFEALDWNRRLWSTLSADCGAKGNRLPKELRAQIISLALWVSRHSSQVALGREDIEPLIDVNRTIMEGLAHRQEANRQEISVNS